MALQLWRWCAHRGWKLQNALAITIVFTLVFNLILLRDVQKPTNGVLTSTPVKNAPDEHMHADVHAIDDPVTTSEPTTAQEPVRPPLEKLCGEDEGPLASPLPAAAAFEQSPDGAVEFVRALLNRQAHLQSCMAAGLRPFRAVIHHCVPQMVCGGIGERLRGIAMALYVAASTNRALFVDHRKPRGTRLETYLEPNGAVNWTVSTLPVNLQAKLRWLNKKLGYLAYVDGAPEGCVGIADDLLQRQDVNVVSLKHKYSAHACLRGKAAWQDSRRQRAAIEEEGI